MPTATLITQSLITEAVDDSRLTVLKGNVHPLARPQFDLGTAPATLPMERMLLVLKRSPEQEHALRALLDAQQDKHSTSYHKWLTPEQFGKQFGPTDSDMQTITGWLQSHGFQVGASKGRTVLEFSGTAGQVREAFHTSIHKYAVNGEQHWANANDLAIPAALAPAVVGVKTLHNFLKKPQVHLVSKSIRAKAIPNSQPQFTDSSTGTHYLSPEDYGVIYNATPSALNSLSLGLNGQGTILAVVARSDLYNNGSDVSNFENVFAAGSSPQIILNGADPGDLGGDDELEATLDASWSGAIATGAQINFVVSASTNDADGVDLSEVYIIENNLGSIMTESFGTCEAEVTSADGQATSLLAEQAAAQGITYIVSAGDSGAEGCDNLSETTAQGPVSVNVLASTPFTVAAGGTMFNENGQDSKYWNSTNDTDLGSAISYIPEDVWNETCTTQCQDGQLPLAAGGGGASDVAGGFFAKPSWQFGVSNIPSDGARDLPDISLTSAGHDPYLLCLEGSCVPDEQGYISFAAVEGTSAAAPSFAGFMALVDQITALRAEPQARQGQADYMLYVLAAAQQNAGTACNASSTAALPATACVFNDVTVGNNAVPGEINYGLPNAQYQSGVGYDLASGLGSVNVANLISAWDAATFNATSTTLQLNGGTTAITITHGSSVPVLINVSANSGTPAGDVSLIANPILFDGDESHQVAVPLVTSSPGPTLTGGSLSASVNSLPGSATSLGAIIPYSVSAYYAGIATGSSTTTFAPSYSSPVMVTVTPESSTTTFAAPLGGVFTQDQNGNWTVPVTTAQPFGSPIMVTAVVQGASGVGTPTGSVTFSATGGSVNPNPIAVNSQGTSSLISNPFLVSGPTTPFDAGSYVISASYGGDSSFNASKTTQPAIFSIEPGFVAVSGPANVTITSPGQSGTTTIGTVASSNFTNSVSFSCSNLPAEASCAPASATPAGPMNIVTTTITISTTAPHLTSLYRPRNIYFARMLSGEIAAVGICVFGFSRRRRRIPPLLVLLVAAVVLLPSCGGGSKATTPPAQMQDPGTPPGTYTVTITATGASITQSRAFTLVVQ